MDSIIFDVDGTIWDASGPAAEAWNEIIEREIPNPVFVTAADLKRVYGMTLEEMADKVFHYLPQEERVRVCRLCFANESPHLLKSHGVLFPGVYETLRDLSRTLPLYIVSNCQTGYVDVCIKTTGLEPFISGHLCNGETHAPKAVTLRMLMERYGLKETVYIGDTAGDAEACREAKIPFIWASYGFGNVPDAKQMIRSSMAELPGLLGL